MSHNRWLVLTIFAIWAVACSDTTAPATLSTADTSVGSPDSSLGDSADVSQTCYSCHGDPAQGNEAPPLGTKGEELPTDPAVGAHQNHLEASDWHRTVQCAECHVVPTAMDHKNGTIDFAFSGVAISAGATPTFAADTLSCSGGYCHGASLRPAKAGGSNERTPIWNQMDGTFNACGTACHTLPPGGNHPQNTACEKCHGSVIASFDPVKNKVVWVDATRHVDGKVDATSVNCTSCHGNAATGDPAPPLGTKGETAVSEAAVGAHQNHLAPSTWHKQVACEECHQKPTDPLHSNGVVDFAFGPLATAKGAKPAFDTGKLSCASSYCHGTTLLPAKAGAAAAQEPVWTQVDGTFNKCGTACHTLPPGGTHPADNKCSTCHASVVASFDPASSTATWKDASLHINGKIEAGGYHTLPGWVGAKFLSNGTVNKDHHGATFFVANQQRDDKNTLCTQCHGTDYNGGSAGVSCNNNGAGCHGKNPAGGTGGNWQACNFCHGSATQNNPAIGVGNEQTSASLAVGRHSVHLSASSTHVAFDCSRCHTVPPASNVAHALEYVPSLDLGSAGHHGDVTFLAAPTAFNATGSMAWNVAGTQGNPVSARGNCTGACHSNGRGGPPAVSPYWAGGTWTAGSCGNCHAASPNTKHHGTHVNGDVNLACSSCHPGANEATHLNGIRDVKTSISGAPYTGSVTAAFGVTSKCSNGVTCSGTCHGEIHNARCW